MMELLIAGTLFLATSVALLSLRYRPLMHKGIIMLSAALLSAILWLIIGIYGLNQPTCMEQSPHAVCDGLESRGVIIVLTVAFAIVAFIYGIFSSGLVLWLRGRR